MVHVTDHMFCKARLYIMSFENLPVRIEQKGLRPSREKSYIPSQFTASKV